MSDRRYYTVDEANALVPWLESCFARIMQLRLQLRALYGTLEDLGHRPDAQNVRREDGPEEVRVARAKFVGVMELLQDDLTAIHDRGIEVKDIDTGLCDFWSNTTVPGIDVYLCWRYGEKRIEFYHEPHAGFAGRKPLPMPASA